MEYKLFINLLGIYGLAALPFTNKLRSYEYNSLSRSAECVEAFLFIDSGSPPFGLLEESARVLAELWKSVGVESFQDEAGNIIYRKPATPGMETVRR